MTVALTIDVDRSQYIAVGASVLFLSIMLYAFFEGYVADLNDPVM